MTDFNKLYDSLPGAGWLSRAEAELLHRWAAGSSGPILEVGCFQGRSTCLLASLGRTVYSVDPFAGFSTDDPSGGNTLAAWMKNVADRGYSHIVNLFATRVEDWYVRPCGFAYLDGDHTYTGTLAQIKTAMLCGASRIAVHDVNDSGGGLEVKRAAVELLGPWAERTERLAVWEMTP